MNKKNNDKKSIAANIIDEMLNWFYEIWQLLKSIVKFFIDKF